MSVWFFLAIVISTLIGAVVTWRAPKRLRFFVGYAIVAVISVGASMHFESPAKVLSILVLGIVQNTAFSVVSRSRNRDKIKFHMTAAMFSNGVWYVTLGLLVKADMTFALFLPYCFSTVVGSVIGVQVSMWIERLLGATSDSHIKTRVDVQALADRVAQLEKLQADTSRTVNDLWAR